MVVRSTVRLSRLICCPYPAPRTRACIGLPPVPRGGNPHVQSRGETPHVAARYPAELGAYEIQKQVGTGQTAAVWAARVRETGDTVAVKVFNIQYLKGDKVGR